MSAQQHGFAKPQGTGGKAKPKEPPAVILGDCVLPGNGLGELVEEADPRGTRVVHAYRRDASVHDRLYKQGAISRKMHSAGETFRKDFEIAGLIGNMPAVDLQRSARGQSEISTGMVWARQKVNRALTALGAAPGNGPWAMMAHAAWHVVGNSETLEQWVQRCRLNMGWKMDVSKASGLVVGALEALGIHYKLIDRRDIAGAAEDRGFRNGVKQAVEMLTIQSNLHRTNGEKREAAAVRFCADEIRKRLIDKEREDGR